MAEALHHGQKTRIKSFATSHHEPQLEASYPTDLEWRLVGQEDELIVLLHHDQRWLLRDKNGRLA